MKNKLERARNTISSHAFHYIVMEALKNRESLSVVRMADGEKLLLNQTYSDYQELLEPPFGHDASWLDAYGVAGITKAELHRRLSNASNYCTYFAPSVSGLTLDAYDLDDMFIPRLHYVDNFFVNDWNWEMKEELFKAAGHVLLIHHNAALADSMQLRVQANLGVKVSYIKLSSWRESEAVIELSDRNTAPLVLYSGGPGSKYIGPCIALKNKVVLDLGAAAQHWTFEHLELNREKAIEFHSKWIETNMINV